MKRIELFEFEDFSWFPSWVRNAMTALIVVLQQKMGIDNAVKSLLVDIRSKYHFDQIVDLGSGSGGILLNVVQAMNKEGTKVKLLLSDIYPNATVFEHVEGLNDSHIQYAKEAFDATQIKQTPKGLKTLMNCFHHMSPKTAKSILESAYKAKEPVLIYEMAENNIPLFLWWLLLPISLAIVFVMALFLTLFIKPLTWKHVVFTFLLPIIPMFYAWDGQASLVRIYTKSDIKTMLEGIDDDPNYTWEIRSVVKENGKNAGYAIFGCPINA